MIRSARALIVLSLTAFVVLALTVMFTMPGSAASAGSDPVALPGPAEHPSGSALLQEPCCTITQTQAEYGQTTEDGLTVTPLMQWDPALVDLLCGKDQVPWLTVWTLESQVSRTVTMQFNILHCQGDISELSFCTGDKSAFTTTQHLTVTVDKPLVAVQVVEPVSRCCELAEAELVEVDGKDWGSSFFDRKAWSPWCNATPTPTPTSTRTNTPTRTPTRTPTSTYTPTPTPTSTPTRTPTSTLTPTPSICGWGSTGRPEDKDPQTATLLAPGSSLPVQWYSDIGNGTNWIRIVGNGKLVKFWMDQLNPPTSRFWLEAYIDPLQAPIVRNECYALTPCYLHTRAGQVYYIKGQIMTQAGCSRWNADP